MEPLKLTCTTQVKANYDEQEYELKRSAMRAVAALLNISGAENSQLNEFITQIKSTPLKAYLFKSIKKDIGDFLGNQMEEEMKVPTPLFAVTTGPYYVNYLFDQ